MRELFQEAPAREATRPQRQKKRTSGLIDCRVRSAAKSPRGPRLDGICRRCHKIAERSKAQTRPEEKEAVRMTFRQ